MVVEKTEKEFMVKTNTKEINK